MFSNLNSGADTLSSPEKNSLRLTRAKREIICNYVVYLHSSFFKTDPSKEDAFAEYFNEPLPEKLRALHSIATNFAKSLGASDQEINDTVMMTSVFCTYQRSLGQDNVAQKIVKNAPVYTITGNKAAFA